MNRGAVEGLDPPRSLASGLPAAFFGNDFTAGLVSAFDEVLAPVFATLDDFDAYLDPRYAPEDFLRWLCGWLGSPVDERLPADGLRARLRDSVEAVMWRGTVRGVAAAVRSHTGRDPRIEDSGAVSTSHLPMRPLPGAARQRLVVRVSDPDGNLDADLLHRVVAAAKPAHVPHEVVIER